jgi:hypothetical protein
VIKCGDIFLIQLSVQGKRGRIFKVIKCDDVHLIQLSAQGIGAGFQE